jgi:hypothetical protein
LGWEQGDKTNTGPIAVVHIVAGSIYPQ